MIEQLAKSVTPRLSLKRRRPLGQSIIEVLVGTLILIPIVLLAVDANFMLSANRSNQELAHNIARVAANRATAEGAQQAANEAIVDYQKTNMVKMVKITEFNFDKEKKMVTVAVTMDVSLPVPLPGGSDFRVVARWGEPIVAIPAST